MRDPSGPSGNGAEPSLDAKVAFLRERTSYPDANYRVEALETHMSWVFLLDRFVYKLKKPISYELLDCRGLDSRRYFCEQEMSLNLRLAPQVYLGMVPLTIDQRHHLALAGRGHVVEWLVRMQRLPAESMLDYAILHHAVGDTDLLRLAKKLTTFYLGQPAEPIECNAYRERFRRLIDANCRGLEDPVYELPQRQVLAIKRAQGIALGNVGDLLDQRVRSGRIIEGHGDLRPEHIYLGEQIAIIDCLEFARQLRIVDVVDELGFLALECERLGSAATGTALLHSYSLLSADFAPAPLLHFYQSCRASTRALIAARHLLDEKFRHSPHWWQRASLYLELAENHIEQVPG